MFNKYQLEYMRELEAILPHLKCYCGWYRLGECPHCPAGKTCADKLFDRPENRPAKKGGGK